ncbi:MAG: hypothetical protein V4677_02720 [Bacteroidota bacterium]
MKNISYTLILLLFSLKFIGQTTPVKIIVKKADTINILIDIVGTWENIDIKKRLVTSIDSFNLRVNNKTINHEVTTYDKNGKVEEKTQLEKDQIWSGKYTVDQSNRLITLYPKKATFNYELKVIYLDKKYLIVSQDKGSPLGVWTFLHKRIR